MNIESKEKKVPEKIYVVPMKKFSFVVPELDEKGNKIPKCDPLTGVHIRVDSRPQYYEQVLKFTNLIDNVQKGCLCQYVTYKDTPQVIKDRLDVLCKSGTSSVITRDEWVKLHNLPQWEEMQRRERLEKELKTKVSDARKPLLETIANMEAEIAELSQKTENYEKGKK